MATKDYKKDDNKYISKKYLIAILSNWESYENIYKVSIWNRESSKMQLEKKFKSKAQAIKFAKNYMKTH